MMMDACGSLFAGIMSKPASSAILASCESENPFEGTAAAKTLVVSNSLPIRTFATCRRASVPQDCGESASSAVHKSLKVFVDP
jgi:hypothetical protein